MLSCLHLSQLLTCELPVTEVILLLPALHRFPVLHALRISWFSMAVLGLSEGVHRVSIKVQSLYSQPDSVRRTGNEEENKEGSSCFPLSSEKR